MSTPSRSVTESGPMRSAKHHAPTVRRACWGRTRRTGIEPTTVRRPTTSSVVGPAADPGTPVPPRSAAVTGPLMASPPGAIAALVCWVGAARPGPGRPGSAETGEEVFLGHGRSRPILGADEGLGAEH